MLAKKYRFHGYGSLNYLFKNGKGLRSELFGIKYIENTHRKDMRVAVIISKKVYKSAVKRNRCRRRVFEILRELLPENLHYDLAITIFSPEVESADYKKLHSEIKKILQKSKLIK